MKIIPDADSTVSVELFEPEDGIPPDRALVRVFLDYPVIAEVTTQKITLWDADGQRVLWEKKTDPGQPAGHSGWGTPDRPFGGEKKP